MHLFHTSAVKGWPLSMHSSFLGKNLYSSFGMLPPYRIEACCWPTVCTVVRAMGILGSSLSSGAARGCLRIRQKAPEDGI
jgi:hypothetical protein